MTDSEQVAGRSASGEDRAPEIQERPLTKAFLVSGLILFSVVLVAYGSNVLIPLAVALLVWFFINALAKAYRQLWSKWFGPMTGLSIVLALLTMVAASLLALDVVISNVSTMRASSADFERSLTILLDKLAAFTGVDQEQIMDEVFGQFGLGQLLSSIVSATTSFANSFAVVFIYVVFLLIEQKFFDLKLNAIVRDEKRREQIRGILERIGHDVQSYLWIMAFVSMLTAGLSYLVMVLVGVNHAAFWAFLILILNFIPTIGSIIGTALPSLYGLLQFGEFGPFLVLLAAIGTIQFLVGNVLQPRLSAKTLNLSQFVVILSLFVWGAMWGIAGMFLAVPITVILMIILSNFPSTKPVAALLSETGEVDTDSDS